MQTSIDEVAHELLVAYSRYRRVNWKQDTAGGLRRSEIMVLWCVRGAVQASGTGVRVSELSTMLNLAPPTVTQQMNDLEARGFVERTIDPEDRRAVRIRLAPKAEKAIDAAHTAFLASFRGLVEYLGEDDSRKLAELLSRSFAYFQKISEDTPS